MNAVVKRERDNLMKLESFMRGLPQIEIEPQHTFADGLYARTIVIPAGVVLTGKIHRASHINFIQRGDISVLTEHGIRRFQGPCMLVSAAGIKRAGYAHAETIWTTVHASTQTDPEKLEDELIAKTFEEFDALTVEADRKIEVLP